MKSENMNKYLLLFCYVFFSFAVAMPEVPMNVYDWIRRIAVSSAVLITLIIVFFEQRVLNKYVSIIIGIFLFLLTARRINNMYSYMQLYHQQIYYYSDYIVIAFAVIMMYSIKEKRIYQLSLPFVSITAILIMLLIVLNYNKFNPSSLYLEYSSVKTGLFSVTLFDYIIPMYLLFSTGNKKIRSKGIAFVFITDFILIIIIIFIFGCIKGDLLYSLSPLQIIFQISGTEQMKNYDAIFNILLYFSFFSSVAVNIAAYKNIKMKIGIKTKFDVAFIIPALFIVKKIDAKLWLLIQIIVIALIISGRKSQAYEKG